ncbi:MAG: MG2 domain-containing protein, partial [Anaerolineae bacterium]|nr:MG2 domain-containing protein [Anaerolineae bacterium]
MPSSPRARRIRWITLAVVCLTVAGVFVGAWAYDTLPERLDRQQTLVFGQTRLAPGTESALRVIVREAGSAEPIADADVQVSLAPEGTGPATLLYRGRSGPDGALAASFTVPQTAAITQTLIVEAQSPAGRDLVKQPVTVERAYRLLLTTDKPVYQPAQTVHMRALAFSTLDMRAVEGGEVRFLVEDPKGNKVFRKTVTTSEFGVAAADLVLADEVTHGDYKVSVSLFDTTSEKTITVKPYVLPKYAVKISTERSYYLPGERVAGVVQCDYFFGKPVAGAEVEIEGSVFDVEQVQVVSILGRTDEAGSYAFAFDLPEYFAGRGLERDQAEFSLQVTVVDQARHTEQASRVLPIARAPIIVEAVPEAGVLKPGLENRLYILTSYPDGQPARTHISLAIGGEVATFDTGDHGLAEFSFTPAPGATRLSVTASDQAGRSTQREIDLEADQGRGVVLLRPDRATYRVGDTMHLVALSSVGSGSLFLDVVKDGQTLSTRSQTVKDGQAEFAIDLSGDLFGTLALHAYKVLADGSIIRDTRLVVVDAPRELAADIEADRPVYRPGESARLTFRTHTAAGPVASALGVAIVDESVFAVMEQDPGFARLYFLLQKELLEPKYQVKGFTVPEVLTTTEDAQLQLAQDQAARAAWAPVPTAGLGLAANSRPAKMEAAARTRRVGLSRVADAALIAVVLVPLALWATAIVGLRATGVLGKAMGRFGLILVGLAAGSPLACMALGLFVVVVEGLGPGVGL